MTYSDEKHIDCIMNRFDFEVVKKYMDSTNWKWSNDRVPTLSELKSTALILLMNVKNGDSGDSSSTGGFIAMKRSDFLELYFSISEKQSIYLNLSDDYKKDKLKKERKEKLEIIDEIFT